MSSRDLFVVLTRVGGLLFLLWSAVNGVAGGVQALVDGTDFDRVATWFGIAIAAETALALALVLFAPALAGLFPWPERSGPNRSIVGLGDWVRVGERTLGLLAWLFALGPLASVLATWVRWELPFPKAISYSAGDLARVFVYAVVGAILVARGRRRTATA